MAHGLQRVIGHCNRATESTVCIYSFLFEDYIKKKTKKKTTNFQSLAEMTNEDISAYLKMIETKSHTKKDFEWKLKVTQHFFKETKKPFKL